jgi:hypothetical protein
MPGRPSPSRPFGGSDLVIRLEPPCSGAVRAAPDLGKRWARPLQRSLAFEKDVLTRRGARGGLTFCARARLPNNEAATPLVSVSRRASRGWLYVRFNRCEHLATADASLERGTPVVDKTPVVRWGRSRTARRQYDYTQRLLFGHTAPSPRNPTESHQYTPTTVEAARHPP